MQLNNAQAVLRPRNPWEAMDLGILLARRHAAVLMLSWAVITLPLFALLTLIFWQQPSLAVLIIWWLKPAFERLPLYILSNALFAHTPSCMQSLKAFPALLKPQLLASLTWRRLSLTRSFDLPVQQLEGLAGAQRQQRLVTLGQNYTRAPTWLTIIGLHIEMALWLGLVTLLYLLIPAQLQTDWSWAKLIAVSQSDWLWAEHLSNLLYVLVLVIWEPIYVACGFTLYLNRRTVLEAWDLELAFRNLAQRLKNSALVILCALLCCMPLSKPVFAQPLPSQTYAPDNDELGVDQPRLLKQMLNSEQARQSIERILAESPFENYTINKQWHFGDPKKASQTPSSVSLPDWLKGSLQQLSFTLQILLWSIVLLASAALFWRYRQWLHTFSQRLLPSKQPTTAPRQSLLDLETSSATLPNDLLGSAQTLWATDPRAALSLLYRALLNHLLEEHKLPLKPAHTEGEVLAMTHDLAEPLRNYSEQLTLHWQNLAWGHQQLTTAQFADLCTQWQQLQNVEHLP